MTLDLGVERRIHRIALYVLDDGPTGEVRAPTSFDVQMWRAGRWVNIPAQRRDPAGPAGRRANQVSFRPVSTARIRIILVPRDGVAVGLSELEVWGPASLPLAKVTAVPRDLAFNAGDAEYPRASASFTSASSA